MDSRILLEVKNSRDSEEPVVAMEQALSALGSGHGRRNFLSELLFGLHDDKWMCLEIIVASSRIHFFVSLPPHLETAFVSQITAVYPKITLTPVGEYIEKLLLLPHASGQLVFGAPFYYPLKTHKDVADLDTLAGIVGQLSRVPDDQCVLVQYRISPAGSSWRHTAQSIISKGIQDMSYPERTKAHPQARIIERKASETGYETGVRIVATAPDKERAEIQMQSVAGAFGIFSLGEGNSLQLKEPLFWQKTKLDKAITQRSGYLIPRNHVFSVSELATLWHPPGLALAAIKNIAWGTRLSGEAPENLPITVGKEEEDAKINFFARTEYKNKLSTFGIKKEDRRKHVYMVGKTGTGKSTVIANMAINDMRHGEGLAVVDPHGDLCETILDYVPSFRINDVAYLNPSDVEYPFHLNPLEVKNSTYRELVTSGIVSIFYKLYHYSWGPRLEYILRNAISTLLTVPDSTLLSVPDILTNDAFRAKTIEKLDDRVLKNFWLNEFNKMTPQIRIESISPILNKVGQFLTSQTIRNIVGSPVSTIDLETMMNEGKIVIVNLSQGKLGEDSSALLGSMIITKFQLAAMNRVYTTEKERHDFYLYVDEFQNFATNSFIKILSEARKYRLNLMLANQYIGQIDEEVQKAIFGNAGSLISFGVGAADARLLSREFGTKYTEDELVAMGNYEIALKLSIDNHTSHPFSGMTLPLPKSKNQNREKVIRASRERYCKKI